MLLPVPPVELLEPVALDEPAVPGELVPVLVGDEVPVAEVPLTGVAVPVVGADPVAVTLDGAVPADVEDGPLLVETGALGSAGVAAEVPSGLAAGVELTGAAVGSAGSTGVGKVPGGYRVVSWSGSSLWVSGIHGVLPVDRERRWPVRVDDGVGVRGFEAEPVAVAAEPVTGAAAVWLTLVLDVGVAFAVLAVGCRPGAGARAAA